MRAALAALLVVAAAAVAAAEPEPQERSVRENAGEAAAQVGNGPSNAVFTRGGTWSRAEVAFLLGSQRVREDLGVSRNIFATVSADAANVGFGEHYGARASLFLNRWIGVEGSWFRTTTEFQYSVTDAEAGTILLEDALTQTSDERAGALVLQWPFEALTPYAALGYGSRTSELGEGDADPFDAGAFHAGAGIKVPFGDFPLSITFDYRHVRYLDVNESIRLAEGGTPTPTSSVFTVGVMLRTSGRH